MAKKQPRKPTAGDPEDTVQLNLRVPRWVREALNRLAADNDRTPALQLQSMLRDRRPGNRNGEP